MHGAVERTVKTVKHLSYRAVEAGQDLYLSLLVYRVTPLSNVFFPALLLMGRQLLEPATPGCGIIEEI